MATTRIIFNIPVSVKKKAAARAKREGLTLTRLLTTATDAYARGQLGLPDPELRATPAAIARFRRLAAEARRANGRSPTFADADSAIKWLQS